VFEIKRIKIIFPNLSMKLPMVKSAIRDAKGSKVKIYPAATEAKPYLMDT